MQLLLLKDVLDTLCSLPYIIYMSYWVGIPFVFRGLEISVWAFSVSKWIINSLVTGEAWFLSTVMLYFPIYLSLIHFMTI